MQFPDYLINRAPDTAKWHYGHALLVGGSFGRLGCALLAGRACLRTGAGLLTIHVPARCVDPIQAALPEAMLSLDSDERIWASVPSRLERYDALAIGPGIGTDPVTQQALRDTLAQWPAHKPLILDADALRPQPLTLSPGGEGEFSTFQESESSDQTCLGNAKPRKGRRVERVNSQFSTFQESESSDQTCLGNAKPRKGRRVERVNFQFSILTPHVREMARFGCSPEELVARTGATILLKGHTTTIYSPNDHKSLITTGNAGMATAGSGDVLTGILLGLASQNAVYPSDLRLSAHELALLGAQIHGISGEIYAKMHPQCTLIASDLIENLPDAIAELSRR